MTTIIKTTDRSLVVTSISKPLVHIKVERILTVGYGAHGPQGLDGPQGFTIRGEDGEDGQNSFIPGPAGLGGETGAQGVQGQQGLTIRGSDGDDGDDGVPGQTGPAGPQGAQGTTGATGAQGTAGQSGPDGLTIRANDGEDGADGFPGPPGAQGSTGDTGATGAQGVQGIAGAAGLIGPPGTDGEDSQGWFYNPDAASLLGGTWARPGAIGSTTANTGAFTSIAGTSAAILGRMGVGSEGPTTDVLLRLVCAPGTTTGASQYATFNILQLGSDCTGTGFGNYSRVDTAAAAFNCGDVSAFIAATAQKGAGSTISRVYGCYCYDQNAGNENYGYVSAVSAGAGKWNFFGVGTAESYLGGSLKIGGTAARATTGGTNRVDIFDGTAPVGTLANGCSLYSTAGELRVMDAAGNASLLSPHDKADNAWIYFSKNTVTGKVLKIDMEKMMRALNEKLGGGFIHEWMEY